MSTLQQLGDSYLEQMNSQVHKDKNQDTLERVRVNVARKIRHIHPRGDVFFRLLELHTKIKKTFY